MEELKKLLAQYPDLAKYPDIIAALEKMLSGSASGSALNAEWKAANDNLDASSTPNPTAVLRNPDGTFNFGAAMQLMLGKDDQSKAYREKFGIKDIARQSATNALAEGAIPAFEGLVAAGIGLDQIRKGRKTDISLPSKIKTNRNATLRAAISRASQRAAYGLSDAERAMYLSQQSAVNEAQRRGITELSGGQSGAAIAANQIASLQQRNQNLAMSAAERQARQQAEQNLTGLIGIQAQEDQSNQYAKLQQKLWMDMEGWRQRRDSRSQLVNAGQANLVGGLSGIAGRLGGLARSAADNMNRRNPAIYPDMEAIQPQFEGINGLEDVSGVATKINSFTPYMQRRSFYDSAS